MTMAITSTTTTTGTPVQQKFSSNSNPTTTSILPLLPLSEQNKLLPLLHTFTTRHQSHHRPIVLLTSGGTATDLEVNAVRCLDNFSTGLRGAISVEEFLKRGYAVIHLWRRGSAAPFLRVLNDVLVTTDDDNEQQGGAITSGVGVKGLSFDSLGKLFEGQQYPGEEDDNNDGNDNNDDPWLSSPSTLHSSKKHHSTKHTTADNQSTQDNDDSERSEYESSSFSNNTPYGTNEIKLSKHVQNSTILQTKLRERAHVIQEGLLLTVPFRTVEEYLAKLQLCTEAIRDCQSLGLIYLAAAVSDFYIPEERKSTHKIQSRDYGLKKGKSNDDSGGDDGDHALSNGEVDKEEKNEPKNSIEINGTDGGITIHLSPVPKCISFLREKWAPDAFCVSFKLETDKDILYDKSKMAMDKYGVHMVIGNILATRREKVWVLQRKDFDYSDDGDATPNEDGSSVEMVEISKGGGGGYTDELEDALISHIVDQHFHYISTHISTVSSFGNNNHDDDAYSTDSCLPRTALMAGAEAAARHNAYLREKRRRLQNELYWRKVKNISLNVIGHAVGVYVTYMVRSHLAKRIG